MVIGLIICGFNGLDEFEKYFKYGNDMTFFRLAVLRNKQDYGGDQAFRGIVEIRVLTAAVKALCVDNRVCKSFCVALGAAVVVYTFRVIAPHIYVEIDELHVIVAVAFHRCAEVDIQTGIAVLFAELTV